MIHNTEKFAPAPGDSIRELRWKAESMLEYLGDHELFLRRFPTGCFEERRALWQPLAGLLERAMEHPDVAEDARLEAHRVWAEEARLSALFTVTMCVHARGESARRRFADLPEQLEELLERLEQGRTAALALLSTDDRDALRQQGFLRAGE